ncbi:MAG TPA: hypothetical protein VHD63_24065 [Ktedonobacteraceae bacterium]|nr:hypothetical protein [Ktedonobacteraceae bacterium]
MRTLDAALTTALAGSTRRPALSLTIEDHTIHLSPFQTPGLSDRWSDCCVASDGSLVYVSLTRGGTGFDQDFQYTRITDPSIASQWSTLTTFSGGSDTMFQDGCCCISNNGGTLRAFAQQGTISNNVLVWTSTTNGASWTGPVAIMTPPGGALMKGIASAGNNDVFFFYDVTGGDTMAFSSFSGGSWSAATTWTLPNPTNGAGIAAYWTGSQYNLVYSDGYTLHSATYNGTTWTPGTAIASASSTSVGRLSPRLSFFDGLYHLTCSEYDSGTFSGASYQFVRVRESADFVHWSDGWIVPEISTIYGGNYLFLPAPQSGTSGARYYLLTPGTVLSTQAFSTSHSNQYLDVSASVLSYRRTERVNQPAEFVCLIDNRNGQYNGLVNLTGSTSYQPLGPGATMKLSEGYHVSGVPDTILTGAYRIMKVALLRSPTQNAIQLTGLDLTERLDRRIRWQTVLSGQTLSSCLAEVAARAGLFSITITGGAQLGEQIITFVLQANQTYRHALDALCTTYGLDYFMDQNETFQIREIMPTNPSVWSYQNEIEQVAFGQDYQRANHVVVNGKPPGGGPFSLTSSEAYDTTANAATRVERLLHHTDLKMFTTGQTTLAASLVLYAEQRAQTDTRLIVPLNPALQLLDVLTVTDAPAPTGTGQSVTGRLIEHQAIFNAQNAEYESHLSLQGQ